MCGEKWGLNPKYEIYEIIWNGHVVAKKYLISILEVIANFLSPLDIFILGGIRAVAHKLVQERSAVYQRTGYRRLPEELKEFTKVTEVMRPVSPSKDTLIKHIVWPQ